MNGGFFSRIDCYVGPRFPFQRWTYIPVCSNEAFKLAGCLSIFLGTVSLPFDPPQGREGLERSNRRMD